MTGAREAAWRVYCDGVRLSTGPKDNGHAASTLGSPERRIAKLSKRFRALGLEPSQPFSRSHSAGIFASLSPCFRDRWPSFDTDARAAGDPPRDMRAVLEACWARRSAQRTRGGFRPVGQQLARVTGLHIAVDLLGADASRASNAVFPSILNFGSDERHDLIRLRGWEDLPTGPGRLFGAWTEHKETAYARRRRGGREPRTNLAVYSDRASKLDPGGPPALHVELRLRGSAVPQAVRDDPLALLPHLTDRNLWRLFLRQVEVGTKNESRVRSGYRPGEARLEGTRTKRGS